MSPGAGAGAGSSVGRRGRATALRRRVQQMVLARRELRPPERLAFVRAALVVRVAVEHDAEPAALHLLQDAGLAAAGRHAD